MGTYQSPRTIERKRLNIPRAVDPNLSHIDAYFHDLERTELLRADRWLLHQEVSSKTKTQQQIRWHTKGLVSLQHTKEKEARVMNRIIEEKIKALKDTHEAKTYQNLLSEGETPNLERGSVASQQAQHLKKRQMKIVKGQNDSVI